MPSSTGSCTVLAHQPMAGTFSSRPVIVMLPYAGGSACSFSELRARLTTRANVLGIDYPGRGSAASKDACSSIEGMANAVVTAITSSGHASVTLWGYSLGAIVAVEVMRQLAQAGSPCRVQHLVAAACRPPHLFQVPLPAGLSDEDFIATTVRLGCLPARTSHSPRVLSRLLPLLRADLDAAARHRHVHAPIPRVPITVLGGRGDPLVPMHDLAAWQLHTQARCQPYVFGGDHFFVNQHLDAIARILLDAAFGHASHELEDALPASFDSDTREAELVQCIHPTFTNPGASHVCSSNAAIQ